VTRGDAAAIVAGVGLIAAGGILLAFDHVWAIALIVLGFLVLAIRFGVVPFGW
jgi:hypothetical protein